MAAASKHSRAWMALGGASLVHLAVLLVWQGGGGAPAPVADTPETSEGLTFASVELVPNNLSLASADEPVLGAAPPPTFVGAVDLLADDPFEGAEQHSSAPGQSLGRRAPGERGEESFTDRDDPSYRSKALWNTVGATQMQNTAALQRGRTTPESIEALPDPAFSDRERRARRAQAGSDLTQPGLADSSGQGGAPLNDGSEWFAMDPRFDSAPTQRTAALPGSIRANAEAPRAELGTQSAENRERGVATEALDAPSRSNRRVASPFDLGAPSSGGVAERVGAGGSHGRSSSGSSGSGTASQRGGADRGLASTEASRSIPYFFSMYRRIDKELRFPKNLALGLEQGETVLSFRLDTKGQVRSLSVQKSSGFKEFDQEAQRAFLAAAPFGRVPKELLRDRSELSVIAPYYFRNPLIR